MEIKMILNKTNPQHQIIFGNRVDTMDGEVLLQIDESGGFHTATQEICRAMKDATPEQRVAGGWDKYETVINALDLSDVTPAVMNFGA